MKTENLQNEMFESSSLENTEMTATAQNPVEAMAELLSSASFQVPGNEQQPVTRIAAIPQGSVVIDPSAIQAIRDFAKANRVGAEKFETFVVNLFQQEIPKHVEKVKPQVIERVIVKGGRPVSEGTLKLRKDVENYLRKSNKNPEKPKLFTSKDIAGHFGVSMTEANNALRYLQGIGVSAEKGTQDNPGKMGRKLVLWGLADSKQD